MIPGGFVLTDLVLGLLIVGGPVEAALAWREHRRARAADNPVFWLMLADGSEFRPGDVITIDAAGLPTSERFVILGRTGTAITVRRVDGP